MSTHARLSPSASHRWAYCTASVEFLEANADKLPPSGSTYADEGTQAHELGKVLLTKTGEPSGSPEMAAHVLKYVEWVRSEATSGTLLVERQVPLYYSPDESGTVDAAVFRPDRIFIGDLKYGVGVSVYAHQNTQLAIYAESIIRLYEEIYDISDQTVVSLNIFQPRDRNDFEPVRNWTLTRGELREFLGRTVDTAVNVIRNFPDQATFVADHDHQCRFCPAKGLCKAYALGSIASTPLAVEVFEPAEKLFELPSPDVIDRPTRIRVLQSAKTIKKWIDALEELETASLMAGVEPAGMKLVAGRSNRSWIDPVAAAKLLKNYLEHDQIFTPPEVISPSKAEEFLDGIKTSVRFTNRLDSLVNKPEGKPTLVPESDKRPALVLDQTKLLPVVEESKNSE